jgi:hypothetical protein
MWRFLFAVLAVTRAAAAAPLGWAEPVQPVAVYKPDESSFIDDAFALREDGRAIAYLTTDGDSRASLHLDEVPRTHPGATIPNAPLHAIAIYWLAADRVLVVDRDAERQKLVGFIFTSKGPTGEKLGPADGIAPATLDGKPIVVTWTRTEKRGVDHAFVAYPRDTLRPIAHRSYKEDAEGKLAERDGPLKLLWFRDGYTAAAVLKAGEYDKAHDIRRPDRFGRFDLFKGKLSDPRELEDMMAFAQASLDHKKHQDEDPFVMLSDDQKKLLLIDGLDRAELTLARDLSMYEPASFASQPLDGGHLLVSATVDPTNRAAVARKKTDPDDIEFYEVDEKSGHAALLLHLPGQGRPSSWQVSDSRVAVLRKSKGFERGGVEIDVHELVRPTPQPPR